ncbi:MAG: imidazole glycerol phosphate synthase subunit HisF, partial [Candidatus Puniceispirillum sp.]|nr:imidazole glycerol phosphate synthase subunit HisF [Candidatus Puniceispirillum sp.]
MLTKRIIACLDVKDGRVVKGVQFRNHRDMGDILELSQRYADEGVDELVFYDITASADGRVVDKSWVNAVARRINIPFCVAGGIRSVEDAKALLNDGADKISVNSPALERPEFISDLAAAFGTQCVVVGIDSRREDDSFQVYQYTGDVEKTIKSKRNTIDWAKQAVLLGAGEIVLNCM